MKEKDCSQGKDMSLADELQRFRVGKGRGVGKSESRDQRLPKRVVTLPQKKGGKRSPAGNKSAQRQKARL